MGQKVLDPSRALAADVTDRTLVKRHPRLSFDGDRTHPDNGRGSISNPVDPAAAAFFLQAYAPTVVAFPPGPVSLQEVECDSEFFDSSSLSPAS